MSKAVLVMDMPSSCRECPLELQKFQCAVNSEIMKDNTIRQDWCPLRELPNPKEKSKAENILEIFTNAGYNACIDELLKGEEG